MKSITVFLILCFFTVSAYAGDDLLGRWKDKNFPDSYRYEFWRKNEFKYKYSWEDQGHPKTNEILGAWKTGTWTIKKQNGTSETCKLFIYAGSMECCFDFEFIGDNLIMKNKLDSNSYAGMCENRVLIRDQ